jgi:hypothetical protein
MHIHAHPVMCTCVLKIWQTNEHYIVNGHVISFVLLMRQQVHSTIPQLCARRSSYRETGKVGLAATSLRNTLPLSLCLLFPPIKPRRHWTHRPPNNNNNGIGHLSAKFASWKPNYTLKCHRGLRMTFIETKAVRTDAACVSRTCFYSIRA